MWQIAYSLLLYTSDEPEKFKYFSDVFTNRLNQISDIHFVEEKKIEDQLFVNMRKNASSPDFEKSILNATQLLKTNIHEKKFRQANELSKKALRDFENHLLQYPDEISKSTLINFYFWNTIAHLEDKNRAQELLNSFFSQTTMAERNALESELTREQYLKFSQLASKYKLFTPSQYEIRNGATCTVFLDGRPLAQNTFTLSASGKNVLNAICANGFYSQLLTQASNPVITILPHIEKSVSTMPSMQWFPKNLLENDKFQSVVFIYWSAHKNYIQTVVVNAADFAEKRELTLQLKTKDDLRTSGDKIARFVFNSFQSLIE